MTNVAWSNTTNAADTAVFGGSYNSVSGTAVTGGAVTVGAGGITLGGISLVGNVSPSYTIGGGTLTFGPAVGTISLTNGTTYNPSLNISSVLAGNALNVTTTSTAQYAYLTLTGSNTYTGGTTVGNAVQLGVGNNAALGAGALTVNGSFFNLNTSAAVTLANNISLGANSMTVNATNASTLNGILTGSGAITKNGASDLTFGGVSSAYTGTINLRAGTIRVANSDFALGTGPISVTSPTTNGSLTALLATQNGGGARNLSNAIAITNNGTGATTLNVDGGYATLTLNGVISGNGNLVKTSTGNVVLNASNSYTGGTNISAGYLSVGNNNALGTGTLLVANGAQNANSVLSTNVPFFNVSSNSAATLPNNIILPSPGSALVYTLQKNSASSSTGRNLLLAGNITGGNSFLTLELNTGTSGDGTTTFEFAGTNTGMTGTVRVNRGAIVLDNANSIGTSSLYVQSNVNSNVGNIDFNGSFTFPNAITTNTAGDSIGVSGSNSAIISGLFTAVAWSKVGTGTLTLAGTNAISAPTTVSGGTLVLGVPIPSTSALSIGSTGTSGGARLNISSGISAAQTFASTTFIAGQSVLYNPSATTLALNAITRSTGATVDFGSTSSGGQVTTTTANGMLGGYATTDGGASFVTVTSGVITALTGTATSTLGNTSASYPNLNIDVNSSPTLDGAITPNSIRFIGAAAKTLTLTGANSVASGGILNAAAVGANVSTITGGTLTGPTAGGDLIIQQYDNVTGNGLTIALVIANASGGATSLVKVGPGSLTLSGSNTYGGATTINAGSLTLVATSTPNSPTFTVNNSGTLILSGNNAVGFTSGKGALITNSGGTITTAATGGFTNLNNVITMTGGTLTSGVSSSSVQYVVQGSGITATSDAAGTAAVIGNGVGLYAGVPFVINTGTAAPAVDVNVTGPLLAGNATGGIIKSGTGVLQLSAANPFTGATVVNAGTINASGGNVSSSTLGKSSSITINSGGTIVATGDNSLIGYGTGNNVPIFLNTGGTLTTTNVNSNHLFGLVTLAGGSLTTPGTNTDVFGSWNFDSGVSVTANSILSATNVVPTQVGGTYFNTANGVTLTVSGTLTRPTSTADTGVIKIGTGTMTLNSINTYTAGTTVNAGTLVLANGGTSGAIRGLLTINNGGTVSATAADAIGYSSGGNVTTLTVNTGGLFDNATASNVGFITNLNLSGGLVTSTGGGAFNFNTGYNISSTGVTTLSTISAPIFFRGAGLNVITAAGVSSGPDLTISGNISYGAGGSGAFNKSGAGVLQLSGSNNYSGGTIVTAGTLSLASANAFPVNSSLTIASSSSLQIANHSSGSSFMPTVSVLTNSGTIDVGNNAMLVHNGAIGTINSQVASAFNGGAWNGSSGTGVITSTAAAADASHLTAVGVATGLLTFQNQPVAATDVLIKYTYYGDATLDGSVDASDYSRIDSAFLSDLTNPAAYTGWYNGDFNYDGVINGSDYTLIDNAFNTQGAAIAAQIASPAADIARSGSAVPEPGTLSLLSLTALRLLGRRRAKVV